MPLRTFSFLLITLMLAGCNRAPEDKTAVRTALMEHLSKNAGLDLSSVDVEMTTLKFEGNLAKTNVSFKPKGSPSQGMSMSYTLERQGNKWVVKGREANAHGGGMANPSPAPGGELPAGHPPVAAPQAK